MNYLKVGEWKKVVENCKKKVFKILKSLKKGAAILVIDGITAATAITNNTILVTRNTKNFDVPGIDVLNPWL